MIDSRTDGGTDSWWVLPAAAGSPGFADHEWALTSLGPPQRWPAVLRGAVSLVLPAVVPMVLWWGQDAIVVHNDAYGRTVGKSQGGPEMRSASGPWALMVEQVRADRAPAAFRHRDVAVALSPIFDDTGQVAGVLGVLTVVSSAMAGTERAQALARLSAALNAAVTAQEVIRTVAVHTNAVLEATQTRIGLPDSQHTIVTVRTSGPGDTLTTVTDLSTDSHDPLAVTIRQDSPTSETSPTADGTQTIHALTVPMRYAEGDVLGAVQVCWQPPATTDTAGLATTRSVLDTIAGLCGQALQRTHLIETTEQVAALAAQLSASHTTAQAIDAILTAAPRILGARLPSVAVPDERGQLRLWHHDLPTGLAEQYADLTVDDPRPIAEVLRTRTRIVLADRDAYRARYPDLPDTAGAHGLTTTIAVPLLDHRGRPLAAVGMGWSRRRPLRTTDLALLDTITDLCEQTLERTVLTAAEHDLVTRLAGRVTTRPPPPPGFDVAVRYEPAITGLNLGGDWYDIIALSDDRLAVIVGDVVGHQVDAAADMAQLRTVLNTLVRLDTPLEDVFTRVTTLLGRGFFGTAIIMIIDPGTELVHLVRAGHPEPMIVPAAGPARLLRTPANSPLGTMTRPAVVSTAAFGPGDTLLAYTDGLVERRTRLYDQGVEDLRAVLDDVTGQTLGTIADTILARIPGTDDDRALTLIRRLEPVPPAP